MFGQPSKDKATVLPVRVVSVPDAYSTREFEEHIRIENVWNEVRLSKQFSKSAVAEKNRSESPA
jgi:hypothetical protein